MQYLGEILSLSVALSWTATALFADVASKRLGALPLNLIRMALSLIMLAAVLWVATGSPYPVLLTIRRGCGLPCRDLWAMSLAISASSIPISFLGQGLDICL